MQNALTYSCTCTSNSSAPGLAYYQNSMDWFICEKVYDNCIQAGENDLAAQTLCKTNEKKNCGHLDPANFTSAAVTTSATSTPTGAAASSGTGAPSSTSTSKAAAATMAAMRNFGTGAMAVGAAAAFGFLL